MARISTKQKIFDSATHIIASKGFEKSSLGEIAENAGIREQTIYLHFKSKEDILFYVFEKHMENYLHFLDEHLQGISGAYNKLRKLVWAHLRYSDINRECIGLALFDCRSNRNFYKSNSYQLIRKYSGIISSILDEGIKEKTFRPDMSIPLVRDIIFGLMDYEAIRYFVTAEEPDAVSDQEDVMRLLEKMLLKKYNSEIHPMDKKQRILKAAVHLIAKKGYLKATIAEIAHEADVAEGTVYEYFKNKEDLLLSISEGRFENHLHQLKLTFMQNDSKKKLRLFMQHHFQQYLDDHDFLVVFLTNIQFNRRFYQSRAYKSQYKYVMELEKLVQKIIDDGNAAPDINIRVFRNMFLGAFTHMTLRWFMVNHGRKYNKMEEIEKVAGLLSDAISLRSNEIDIPT